MENEKPEIKKETFWEAMRRDPVGSERYFFAAGLLVYGLFTLVLAIFGVID